MRLTPAIQGARRPLSVLTAAYTLCLLVPGAHLAKAATFTIGNADVAALKNAINTANSNNQNDTINLATNGSYTLKTVDNTNTGNNGLPVILSDGGHSLTINGNGATLQRATVSGTPSFRLLCLDDKAIVTLKNLSLTHGKLATPSNDSFDNDGGAIYDFGTLTLNNCTIAGNKAASGGGIFTRGYNGTLTLQTCSVSNNTASYYGGGLNVYHGNVSLQHCSIGSNSAGFDGGGLYSDLNGDAVTLNITDTYLQGNSAINGGAIANHSTLGGQGTLRLVRCNLNYNKASYGGAIANEGNQGGFISASLTNCVLNGNAASEGGAFESNGADSNPTASFTNCNFISNTATGSSTSYPPAGGAISNICGVMTVQNCTFDSNVTSGSSTAIGGALYNNGSDFSRSATLTVTGCTLRRNSASVGGGIANDGTSSSTTLTLGDTILKAGSTGANLVNNSGSFTSAGYNLSSDNGAGLLTATGDQTNADPKLDPNGFQWNGGSMQTIALQAGSPAIDKGKSFSLTADERGQARPYDDTGIANASGGDGSDIGAYEVQPPRTRIVTNNNDSGAGSLRRAINDSAIGDTITFAANVTGTIGLTSGELAINTSITITGPGARVLAVSRSSGKFRIFEIQAGAVVISGLTIENGSDAGGGGAFNSGGNLVLIECAILNNSSSLDGGGIWSIANLLTLQRCTLAGNTAKGGGGLAIQGVGTTGTLYDCTFANNTATADDGGGIYNTSNAVLTLRSCTISGNSASSTGSSGTGGGGIFNTSGTVHIGNTIVAGNSTNQTGPDVNGTFSSDGYNLIRIVDGGSGFSGAGDQLGNAASPLNANLSALGDYGGPTDTKVPVSPSPALDQGKSFGLTTDQRGLPRPVDNPALANASGGDGSDIGAYETGPLQTGPTFTVTTKDDHNDGSCTTDDCTLREAVRAANNHAGADTIDFAAGVTGYMQLDNGELNITDDLTISGPGVNSLELSGNEASRAFVVKGVTVTINNLTMQGCKAGGTSYPDYCGGAIYNDHGRLTLNNCNLTGNTAKAANGAAGGVGGAIYSNGRGGSGSNSATLILVNCAVNANTSYTGGGIYSDGYNAGSATLSLNGCTLVANSAEADDGGGVFNNGDHGIAVFSAANCTFDVNQANNYGAAIYNNGNASTSARTSLLNCTLNQNYAGTAGGGVYNFGLFGVGTVTLKNTILRTATSGANLTNNSGTITSGGYNLSNDDGGGFLTATGDRINTDPKLGNLHDNGGATQTMMPQAGSPAIDGGTNNGAPATDQRGIARPLDGNGDGSAIVDIGAVEVQPGHSISGVITNTSGTPLAGISVTRSGSTTPVLTDGAGTYIFFGLANGAYTITPSYSNYAFAPASRTVTVNGADVTGQNFTGNVAYHITGRVTNSSGSALANVTVAISGTSTSAPTNSAGYYTLTVPSGTYTVTPSLSGYAFTPASRSVTVSGADVANQDFVGSTGYNITGRVATSSGTGVGNVQITRTGSSTPVFTNSAGYYTVSNVPNGTYTLTPSLSGRTFTPATKTVTINGADASNQNFTASG